MMTNEEKIAEILMCCENGYAHAKIAAAAATEVTKLNIYRQEMKSYAYLINLLKSINLEQPT